MKKPTQCTYWTDPIAAFDGTMRDRFRLLNTLVEESHWWRYVLECRECGQKYFYEFYEEIDWEHGNDPQYSTYIPVASDEDIATLAAKSHLDLLSVSPRLNKDFPSDAEAPSIYWVRGD